ncbi:MAG: Fur family transcriptional regulator [Chloroflexota bacterium]
MRPALTGDCLRCRAPVSDGRQIIHRLRLAGHQVTPARETVVQAVAAQPRPFTAGQLCAAVAERAPSIGRATVFRTLELLEAERLVDRLHSLRSGERYVVRDPERTGQHHYLVCSACDGVTEVGDSRLDALLRSLAKDHAFRPEGDLVEILGRCQAC